MVLSFGTLPPEIRYMVYRHLFVDKKIHYISARKRKREVPNLSMPAMLAVSKLIRAEVLQTFTFYVPVHISLVSQLGPMTRSSIHRHVRSLRIRLTHHKFKFSSMEDVLAKMPALSEVTIYEDLPVWSINSPRLSVFKERLRLAHENRSLLDFQLQRRKYEGPHRSIIAAFAYEPWCRHLLNGHSALHQRPQVKIYAEIERRLLNDAPRSDVVGLAANAAPRTLYQWLRDFVFPPPPLPPPSAPPARFVNVVGRMSLEDWVMHWELDGEPFSLPLAQERLPW